MQHTQKAPHFQLQNSDKQCLFRLALAILLKNKMMGTGALPAGSAGSSDATDYSKLVDLVSKIDKSKCYARNESSKYPMTNLFLGDSRLGCLSDTDDQLIVHIEFQEVVKIHSIKIDEYNRGTDPDLHPTKVQLFVNRTNMGFEDVDDVDVTQSLDLSPDHLKEGADPMALKFVKFQRVKSVTLFIEESAGGNTVALGGLRFFGYPIAAMNMNNFKKQQES